MRLDAFIITFRRPQHLHRTLTTLLAQSCPPQTILVVDNANDPATHAVVEQFPSGQVRYAPQAANTGPAGGASYGLKTLASAGADWIYWGDDDDPPLTKDTLARLVELVPKTGDDESIAGVAAVGHLFDWKSGVIQRREDSELTGVLDADIFVGNGHSIFRGEVVRQLGPPQAELFFALEDTEYSLRLRRHRRRLLVDGDLMRHYRELTGRLGYMRSSVAALPAGIHQIWRQYYTTRNYIYCMAHRFQRPDLAQRYTARTLAKSFRGWQKGLAFGRLYHSLLVRGVWDGWRGQLGCTVPPQAKYGG